MESGKIDRRRRYTLSVIREAFFSLLAEVGFAKMTVADICRRADINRGTFYLHYEDKFALLDALIDEALAAARTFILGRYGEAYYPAARRNGSGGPLPTPAGKRRLLSALFG